MIDNQPRWDKQLAALLPGKLMLVRVLHQHPDGDTEEQFFGRVIGLDPAIGITMRLEGKRAGENYRLPPDLRMISPAQPGCHHLRATGEAVYNPDYVSFWIVTKEHDPNI